MYLIPFGLIFEERFPTQNYEQLQLEYDEKQGLTVVKTDNGEVVPYVTWSSIYLGKTTTGMATKANDDTPDEDYIK